MTGVERKPVGLGESMTETQFDNGYWYVTELKDFAARIGVPSASRLRKAIQGTVRVEHGRYINFMSDFMAQNPRASQRDAIRAWEQVKRMDAPKTYEAWAAGTKGP